MRAQSPSLSTVGITWGITWGIYSLTSEIDIMTQLLIIYTEWQAFNRLHPKRKSNLLLEIDSWVVFHSYLRQFPVFTNLVVLIQGGDLNNTWIPINTINQRRKQASNRDKDKMVWAGVRAAGKSGKLPGRKRQLRWNSDSRIFNDLHQQMKRWPGNNESEFNKWVATKLHGKSIYVKDLCLPGGRHRRDSCNAWEGRRRRVNRTEGWSVWGHEVPGGTEAEGLKGTTLHFVLAPM